MIKVALLTTDSREHFKDYANPNPFFGTAPEALIEGFKLLPDKVEIHIVSCLQKAPVSSPAKLGENIYYHALHVPNIGWMKTGYQGCIRAVRRKLRDIHPDIVHGQGTERDCAISAVFSGFPSVLTVHGLMQAMQSIVGSRPFSYYWFASQLERLALRRSLGAIAISPYVQVFVAGQTRRSWLIPNALRPHFFDPIPARARQPGVPRLINVGVISPHKRQLEVLELLFRMRQECTFEAYFVGNIDSNSKYARDFQKLLHAMDTRYGGFKHSGFLTQKELRDAYDNADALVHFSKEETFGLVFAEAASRNVSIFASDVGSIRQISKGMSHCSVFPADGWGELLGALIQWIQNRSFDQPRPTLPVSQIVAECHPKIVAREHIEVYRTVVTARNASLRFSTV